jgi:hypothetical protein
MNPMGSNWNLRLGCAPLKRAGQLRLTTADLYTYRETRIYVAWQPTKTEEIPTEVSISAIALPIHGAFIAL